jgi:superfamily II DNA or RNA helicase
MPLRDYQQRAVQQVLHKWANKAKEGLLVMPTGSGKTETGAAIIGEALKYGKRVLWTTHTDELVDQSHTRLHRALGVPVGVVAAGYRPTEAMVQVASIQTLVARETRPPADVVIPDEAHHMMASKWGEVLHHYRGKLLLGLTATPERADGLPLGDIFRWLYAGAEYSQLLAAGHLVPCRVFRPQGLLKGLADDPVSAYLQWGEGRSGFVYVKTVADARRIAEDFCKRGIPALAVDFESPDRDERIAALRDGSVRLLVNVYTLTEGVDVPQASLCMLARGVGHISIFLQMVGRVLRPAPGKTDAIVLDLPGMTHEYGLPTEDRVYSLSGEGIRRKLGAPAVKVCQKCGLSFLTEVACPRCGFRMPEKKVRVYGVQMTEAQASNVPEEVKRDEWARLQARAAAGGFSDAWALKVYREKFGERPVKFSDERRQAEYGALKEKALELGYNQGWAKFRYKATYGSFPPKAWG